MEKRPVIIRTLRLKKVYQTGTVATEALRGVDVQIYRSEQRESRNVRTVHLLPHCPSE